MEICTSITTCTAHFLQYLILLLKVCYNFLGIGSNLIVKNPDFKCIIINHCKFTYAKISNWNGNIFHLKSFYYFQIVFICLKFKCFLKVILNVSCNDNDKLTSQYFKMYMFHYDIGQKLTFCHCFCRSYGSVYKALHKESGQVLAIKQVPVDTDLQEIIKEISIMQQCDSVFIVKYYGSYFKNTDLWVRLAVN